MNNESSQIKKFYFDPEGNLTNQEIADLQAMGATKLFLQEDEAGSQEKQSSFLSAMTLSRLLFF